MSFEASETENAPPKFGLVMANATNVCFFLGEPIGSLFLPCYRKGKNNGLCDNDCD